MAGVNRPMASANDDDVLEAAFRKAARRIAAKPEPRVPEQDPRDRIFPGTMPGPSGPQRESSVSRNRRPAKRKVSPFSIVLGLVLAAVASVLYISNVIAVSRLAAEIGQLEDEYQTLLNEQEMIRAQIARLSGLERIRVIAEEQYGMTYSDAVPGWLTIDPARVEELRALSQTAGVRKNP